MLPRMLRLHPSTYQRLVRLSKEAEKDGAYRVAKRLRAVLLNAEGYTSGELAELLQSPRSKVSEWLQRYQSDGVDGLLEGYRSGRPSELTQKQQQQLGDILDSGPVAYGLDSGIWTSPVIAWLIEEEFGIQYHPGHVRKLLHDWGFSVQQPHTTPHMAGLARMAFCVVYARFKALVQPGNRFPWGNRHAHYAPTVIQPNSAANRSFSAPPRGCACPLREKHPL